MVEQHIPYLCVLLYLITGLPLKLPFLGSRARESSKDNQGCKSSGFVTTVTTHQVKCCGQCTEHIRILCGACSQP